MSKSRDLLPLPPFWDPLHAAEWDYGADPPAVFDAAREWAREHRLAPAADDALRTILLLVDVQRDFCLERGALFVAGRSGRGAIDDNRRLASFIYRNLAEITATVVTLDSHLPHQIFFPSFWVHADGRGAAAHRLVTAEDVATGALVPRAELAQWLAAGDGGWLRAQAEDYCRRLEASGRYSLYLWPPHCLLGSPGHTLAGVVEEARLFHAFARRAQAEVAVKGTAVLTEHYSVLSPEVLLAHDGSELGARNEALVANLLAADRIVVAGQAASHCVRSTLEDLLEIAAARDPAAVRRVWILEDCMSAVTVPDPAGGYAADFTEQAADMLARCRDAGMNVVRTDLPMRSWT